MYGYWIQNPKHGVARIEPRLAMVRPFERFLFIAPVMFTAAGFFLAGSMPVFVLLGIGASCFVGDALIALRHVLRAEVRPPAEVTELAAVRRRQRGG
ncbi:MAG TPA: hypothetical protein VLT47_02775 [Anaeromyxobacteraceae bacterium]|nr:hypothetical protein [Anaeromyxobacteraceae bacterium]